GGLVWRPGVWAWVTVGLFLLVTLGQLIPLSQGFLECVSPVRARILEETAGLLGLEITDSAVAWSVRQAFARWGFTLSLVLFFWVCASLGRDRRTFKVLVWVALAFGTFEAVYGMAQVLIPGVGVLWVPADFAGGGNARGTYINRNHFAGLMEMLWPVALGVTLAQGAWAEGRGIKAMFSEDRVNSQLIRFLIVVLMVVALLFSQSRAGILGAFVGMVVLVGILRLASGRFKWGLRITLLALMALVVVYGGRIGFEHIVERFLHLESGSVGRMAIWEPSWTMVTDHPAGIGLGNYEVVETVYFDPGREGIRYRHAHNDYLQLLAEAGWVGAAPLVVGFFLFIGRGIWRVRRVGFEVGRFRVLVAIGALAGLCSMGFYYHRFNSLPVSAI
ncbi:MAG: O-antigen ligase family protein, partial [Anaerolineales bacterium]|nr:O-antigen ligase family protein [Anaerolineales bacterium]